MKTCAAAILLALLCTVGRAPAAEPAAGDKAENPLAKLPSKPEGRHIEKLKALGDDSWVDLGCPAADPRWGREGVARGRAFSPRMTCAPDLGGAFFCGTGGHGFVKTDGHYMDDLWFYDANAHRWICVYPGADKSTKLHLDKNGFEVNEQGDHIPVSYLSHCYYNTTYNTDLRLYQIAWTQCPWWGAALPQRWEWLDQTVPAVAKRSYGNVGSVIGHMKHPLFWDVAKGKWERRLVTGPGPHHDRYESVLEYIPSLKKTFFLSFNGSTWLYDYAANTWTAGPKCPLKLSYELVGGCDSKRECIYVGKGKEGLARLDLKTNTWQEVKGQGQPESVGGSSTTWNFDSANGVFVVFFRHGSTYVYDPDANKWTEQPGGCGYSGVPGAKHMMTHGFYDAEMNVHYLYLAGDSNNNGATMMAYRYRNLKK